MNGPPPPQHQEPPNILGRKITVFLPTPQTFNIGHHAAEPSEAPPERFREFDGDVFQLSITSGDLVLYGRDAIVMVAYARGEWTRLEVGPAPAHQADIVVATMAPRVGSPAPAPMYPGDGRGIRRR